MPIQVFPAIGAGFDGAAHADLYSLSQPYTHEVISDLTCIN